MKKLFLTLCVVLVSVGALAQKGEQAVGAHVLYGTDAQDIGCGAKDQYNVTDNIRLEAVGDYYLKTDGFSMFDVNVNGHYLFNLSDKVTVYPLVGINYTSWKQENIIEFDNEEIEDYPYDMDVSNELKDSSIGFNIGGGIQYKLSDRIRIGAELKYQTVSGANTAIIGAGITFTL